MVLTNPELIAALQHEVHILLHLAGKVDRAQFDFRPTPRQRSTLELVRYMSMMGPALVRWGLSKDQAFSIWTEAEEEAAGRDFDASVRAIGAQSALYQALLSNVSDATMREEIKGFDGRPVSRGAFLVSLVLGGHAAYRTQLFLYLKSCGRVELTSADLWDGVDTPPA